MHFTKSLTFAAIVLVGAAFAAPSPPKPTKPVAPIIPTINSQSNTCGGGTVYCCNGGDGSTLNLGTCQRQAIGGTCSTTGSSSNTICCQANNSIQVCLAGASKILD